MHAGPAVINDRRLETFADVLGDESEADTFGTKDVRVIGIYCLPINTPVNPSPLSRSPRQVRSEMHQIPISRKRHATTLLVFLPPHSVEQAVINTTGQVSLPIAKVWMNGMATP